jgi:mono/diheme cytochrome c family protein
VRRIGVLLLIAGLWPFAPPALAASPGAGAARFQALGCGGCHAVTRPEPGMTLAQRVARRGPDLWFIGSKLQAPWLSAWLPAPTPILGIRYDRLGPETDPPAHPATPAAAVPDLVAYLMSLTDPDMRTGVVPPERPGPREMLQGRILFSREQQCFACHRLETGAGAEVGGVTGPSLEDAGRRLNPDWVYAYLTDPRRYVPVPRMPVYAGTVYTAYGPAEMLALARYLRELGR